MEEGHNVYAILRASRASSLESIVFTVPYRHASTKDIRTDGGVALLLALARQFSRKIFFAFFSLIFAACGDFIYGRF